MGLFDTFNPLILDGAAQGMLAGREAKIALDQADADRAIRQQTANTLQVQARNEALAPFRAEIARQLQVHDQYRPFHQAGLMQQYGTPNANDPRVQSDMQAWDRTMDPYRAALATDDPDQVRQIMQNSLTQTGGLPPVAPKPPSPAPAPGAAAGASPAAAVAPSAPVSSNAAGPPPQVSDLVRYVGQIPGSPPPPNLIGDLIARGVEVPELYRAPGDGLPPLGTPGNPRHGSAPPPLAPAGSPGNPLHNTTAPGAVPFIGAPLPPGYKFPTARPATVTDSTDTAKPGGPAIPAPPAGMIPAAAPTPAAPPPDAAAQSGAQALEAWLKEHIGIAIPKPSPAPPLPAPVTQPNAAAPTSPPAPPVPGQPYRSDQPNPAPSPVAGPGAPGSQNPSAAAGAPFFATGPDGLPVLRVPGVGDVPTVTAQRVVDQAELDPGYLAAHKYADSIRLVSTLGPIDQAAIEKAVTAEAAAWSNALQRYGELDKMPTDQLNTLMTAYTGEVNAQVAAQRAPSQIALDNANAGEARERTRLMQPKLEQEIQDTIGRNVGVLHQAGLEDAQQQEALARSALQDAQRRNLPAETRIRYIDAVMRGSAEQIKAAAYQKAYANSDQGQTDLAYIAKNDAVMANALQNLGGNGAPINTLQAWIVVRRADTDPKDEVYQRAKQGALQLLQAATASYYGGHPELANGPVPTADAWLGYQLLQQKVNPQQFMNKNDQDSKDKLNAIRSYRAFTAMMNGGGIGAADPALGQPGFMTRFVNNLQAAWKKWQENHPGPFSAWGQHDQIRSFIPPTAAGTVAPAQPSPVPPKPQAPYPPSSYPPAGG